jgi:hypothetical protein
MSVNLPMIVILVNVLVLGLLVCCTVRFVIKRLIVLELAHQQSLEGADKSSTTDTAAKIWQSMSHNLTAVERCDVSAGTTCAICLGELADAVERTGVKKDETARPVVTREPTSLKDESRADKGVGGGLGAASAPVVANGPALQSLTCGHCFHGECIRGWLVHRGTGASCPLCKLELSVRSPPALPEDPAERV